MTAHGLMVTGYHCIFCTHDAKIRMQAFSQMRLSEASTELTLFSALLKQETNKNPKISPSWISRTAVVAAEAMLEACPSVYERHCLLELLSTVDFCDSGIAALKFKRLSWKLQLVEPSLCIGKETVANGPNLGNPQVILWSTVHFNLEIKRSLEYCL